MNLLYSILHCKIDHSITIYFVFLSFLGEPCSGGNRLSDDEMTCVPCDLGTYQPAGENTVCRSCAGDFTTRNTGSTLATDCISKQPPI